MWACSVLLVLTIFSELFFLRSYFYGCYFSPCLKYKKLVFSKLPKAGNKLHNKIVLVIEKCLTNLLNWS